MDFLDQLSETSDKDINQYVSAQDPLGWKGMIKDEVDYQGFYDLSLGQYIKGVFNSDEDFYNRLYEEALEENGSGVTYHDISFSYASVIAAEGGVTFIINLDDGYIAKYSHRGLGGGSGILPADIQTSSGYVKGDMTDLTNYEEYFIQGNAGILFEVSGAIAFPDVYNNPNRDEIVKQNGWGYLSNIGSDITLSKYKLEEVVYF